MVLGPDGRVRRILVTNRDRTMIVNGLSIAFNMVDCFIYGWYVLGSIAFYSLTVLVVLICENCQCM